jgi:hypothetical protein
MRLHDGRYECAHCGEILDIPLVDRPQVVIHAASGKPNMRALTLDGRKSTRARSTKTRRRSNPCRADRRRPGARLGV